MNNNPNRRSNQNNQFTDNRNAERQNNTNQNANGRTMNRQRVTKPSMSPRDKAIYIEKQRAALAKKRKKRKALFDKATAAIVFGTIGAFICIAVLFIYIFFDFRSNDAKEELGVNVKYAKQDTIELSEGHYALKDNEYYVSLTKICQICPFTLHGNVEEMTLTLANGKEALFKIDSQNVNICGTYCLMSSKCYFSGGSLFIPISFFKDFCNGVTTKIGSDTIDFSFSDTFDFKATDFFEPDMIVPDSIPGSSEADAVQFISDLSSYEMYMNPENKDEYLTLVDTQHMLASDYIPEDLTDIRDTRKDGRSPQKMRLYAAKSLEAMFIEMRANGFTDVSVTSGYRSYTYQQQLFDNEVAAVGLERAKTQVAVPGSSEHQSGLCIDMHNLPSASEAFSQQNAYKWLISNCADFGFILRFPKDKTDITNIIYEPWHYRYVGRYHAQKIMSEGLCLEEYLDKISG